MSPHSASYAPCNRFADCIRPRLQALFHMSIAGPKEAVIISEELAVAKNDPQLAKFYEDAL